MLSMMLTREGRTVGLTLIKRIGLHALYPSPTAANGSWRVRCTRISCAIWRSLNQPCLGGWYHVHSGHAWLV